MNPIDDILIAIRTERARQERLKREGKFTWTCADAALTPSEKLAVLAEEFGEVAREVCEGIPLGKRVDTKKLHTELIQVAAVCVAWIEALELDALESSIMGNKSQCVTTTVEGL